MKSAIRVASLTALLWAISVGVGYPMGKCPTCAKPAPAPEIGASSIGLLMAAGFAAYARRNRR